MSVDLRTRSDAAPHRGAAPCELFAHELPQAFARTRDLVAPGAALLALRPLVVETEGQSWSLVAAGGRVETRPGIVDGAARLRLTRQQLDDLVDDQSTPMTLFTAGALDMPAAGLCDFLDWWLVLRAALDARRLHTPGSVTFTDRRGGPLDLNRSFGPRDDVEEMSHFLHQAGFLHIAGLFGEHEMRAVGKDMDLAVPAFHDGDGRSWWATTAGGARRIVRMQGFDTYSPTTAALLREDRFLRLGGLTGDGHTHTGLEGNLIEALLKPVGVVKGICDLPWHKDCSLGRHSYECCSMTVGISVTGADATSGQLRVVAGSHRALIWPALEQPGRRDLPEVDLPTQTGDVTVHLSRTLHMSEPPTRRERRVMYTSFRLPGVMSDEAAAARAPAHGSRRCPHPRFAGTDAAHRHYPLNVLAPKSPNGSSRSRTACLKPTSAARCWNA